MDQTQLEQKVKATMSKVFSLEENQINENSSQDNIEKWDSLGHMNLVVALEEDLGIKLSDEQVLELLNYKLILQTLKNLV